MGTYAAKRIIFHENEPLPYSSPGNARRARALFYARASETLPPGLYKTRKAGYNISVD